MIRLENVRVYYPGGVGLDQVTLEIPDGQILAVLGENGMGKSTFLKAVMGLLPLDQGSITRDGRPVTAQYEDFSFITSEGSIFPAFTAREYGTYLAAFFPRFSGQRYEKLLHFFGVDPEKKLSASSTGERAKAEVSAGFSKGAKVIVMDEPFLGKDMFTRRDFIKLMVTALHEGETLLITTHLIEEIEQVVDRAVILKYGRVRADIMLDELHEEGKTLAGAMMEYAGYDAACWRGLFEKEEEK